VKLAHLVGFIKNKFVTMHCHMNVKHKQIAGFSIAEFQIVEFNLSDRNVPGSTSGRLSMPANVYCDFHRSKFVCKPMLSVRRHDRSSFAMYTRLGHTLESAAVSRIRERTMANSPPSKVWQLTANLRLPPFASVVICVGHSFAPTHHLSVLSVYYRNR